MPVDQRHIWAAGFLDGEGCFQSSLKDYRKLRVEITAAQGDIRPLEILKELYSGSIYWNNNPSGGRREFGVWSIHSTKSISLAIPFLLPHLVVKKEQARVLLQICETAGVRGKAGTSHVLKERAKREHLIEALTGLKKVSHVPS